MRKYITKASERIGVESKSRDGKRAQVVSYSTCENFIIRFCDVNNEENNSQMCSLESGSADENIETMKAYMCKQRGMHLGSKISREEITKKVNQSKYEKYCYITNRLSRE